MYFSQLIRSHFKFNPKSSQFRRFVGISVVVPPTANIKLIQRAPTTIQPTLALQSTQIKFFSTTEESPVGSLLLNRLNEDMVTAMKAKEQQRLTNIRKIKSKVKYFDQHIGFWPFFCYDRLHTKRKKLERKRVTKKSWRYSMNTL